MYRTVDEYKTMFTDIDDVKLIDVIAKALHAVYLQGANDAAELIKKLEQKE